MDVPIKGDLNGFSGVRRSIGDENQKAMLERFDIFAKDHKLQWGGEKCQIMRVGRHPKGEKTEWKIGELPIKETDTYKYLGDIITSDGRYVKNLETRKHKVTGATVAIKTFAASETINKMETSVLLDLHDVINIPTLLANAESWTLNKREL